MDVVPLWLLLAADNPFQTIQRYLNRPIASRSTELIGVLVTLIILVWIGLFAWEWRRRRALAEAAAAPVALIDQLILAHGLDAGAVQVLRNAAARCQLADQVTLFLDPRMLVTSSDPAERALGLRLFGDLGSPQWAVPVTDSTGR